MQDVPANKYFTPKGGFMSIREWKPLILKTVVRCAIGAVFAVIVLKFLGVL